MFHDRAEFLCGELPFVVRAGIFCRQVLFLHHFVGHAARMFQRESRISHVLCASFELRIKRHFEVHGPELFDEVGDRLRFVPFSGIGSRHTRALHFPAPPISAEDIFNAVLKCVATTFLTYNVHNLTQSFQ